MTEEMRSIKSKLSHEWIEASDTGNGFLCPIGAIKDKNGATESELSALCVDVSNNPQND